MLDSPYPKDKRSPSSRNKRCIKRNIKDHYGHCGNINKTSLTPDYPTIRIISTQINRLSHVAVSSLIGKFKDDLSRPPS